MNPELENYTVNQLRDYARENNIRLSRSLRKADLLEEIQEHFASNQISKEAGKLLSTVISNKDLLGEMSKHMNADNLKKFCITNSQYRTVCQSVLKHPMGMVSKINSG